MLVRKTAIVFSLSRIIIFPSSSLVDPHRGNLLRGPNGNLEFIDFGMMAYVSEEERYGLIGLAIGLQNKDLPLVTENLLKVRNLKHMKRMTPISFFS